MIIRIQYKTSLPAQKERDALIDRLFGEGIINWTPPEHPGEMSVELLNLVIEELGKANIVDAIEVETNDRVVMANLGVGVIMGAFPIPVLIPFYVDGDKRYPVFDLSLTEINIPATAKFAGYTQIKDAVPVCEFREDLSV